MIQTNTKTAEVLQREAMDANDGATDRILGAIANAPDPEQNIERAGLIDAEARVREMIGDPNASVFVRLRLYRYKSGTDVEFEYGLNVVGRVTVSLEGKTIAEMLGKLKAQHDKRVREAAIRERVEREFAALDAADSATRHEVAPKPAITAPEDAVDPVAAPLTSIGPSGIGGEYQSETSANPDRRGA